MGKFYGTQSLAEG